jgi:tRNA pseudouridine38-40 synthase
VREGRLIAFDVIGNAFLPHMVRNLAGTLVEIGRGVRPPDAIATLLTTRDRRQAAATAPPQGLCLVRVWYDDVET